MGLLLLDVLKYWPIITFICATVFYLGALHLMVKNSKEAIARMFDQIEELNSKKSQQFVINENFEKDILKIEEKQNRHEQESSKRYGDLVARMDSIFQLLAGEKK